MINKKGIQLNQAFGAVLAVVLVAVLVIIAIFLFDTLGDGFTINSVSISNETAVANQVTNISLDGASSCNFQSNIVGGEVYNGTAGDLVAAGNYTIASNGNMILDAATYDGESLLVSYIYSSGGDACTASQNMVTQFATYPALVGLVGTIVFLGLVIGVLVGSFVFGGRGRV